MFNDASAYDRFMGRYSVLLAPQLADFAGVRAGQRILDVGAGTGVLTQELVNRVGVELVTAAEPSAGFSAALRARFPEVSITQSGAEDLPFEDAQFDAALAQLVVHFMSDPVAGLGQMRRVTRPSGVVAASVWDLAAETSPVGLFWRAARSVDPAAPTEHELPGAHEGDLGRLLEAAGLDNIEQTEMWVRLRHETFDDWWTPFEEGIGPAGRYLAGVDPDRRRAIREAARALVPGAPFDIGGRAWAARGVVPA